MEFYLVNKKKWDNNPEFIINNSDFYEIGNYETEKELIDKLKNNVHFWSIYETAYHLLTEDKLSEFGMDTPVDYLKTDDLFYLIGKKDAYVIISYDELNSYAIVKEGKE